MYFECILILQPFPPYWLCQDAPFTLSCCDSTRVRIHNLPVPRLTLRLRATGAGRCQDKLYSYRLFSAIDMADKMVYTLTFFQSGHLSSFNPEKPGTYYQIRILFKLQKLKLSCNECSIGERVKR